MRNLWVALLLSACVKDKPIEDTEPNGDDGGDDGGTTDCTDDVECAPWQICEAGDCLDGDRNNATDEAEPLLWEGSAEGYINPAGDVDFYSFTADGGEFIRISTTTVEEEDDPYDTVLILRKNTNDKVVAIADEYATETVLNDADSMLYAYLADPGDYTVSVEHAPAWDGSGEPYGSPDYTYTIELSEADGGVAEAKDTFEDPWVWMTLNDSSLWLEWGVLLEEPGDVDYISLDYGVDDAVLYIDGNQYMDGSDAVARVRLLDSKHQAYADLADVGPGGPLAYPHPPIGPYVIEVSDALGGGGPNHWVFVYAIARTDTDTLPEVEPNDQSVEATSLPLTEYQNGNGDDYSLGQAEGDLSTADEDWFLIDAPYEESRVIVCMSSSSYGSLVAPDIGVYDADGHLLDSAEGDATSYPNANLENVLVSPGDAYVRVAAPKDNAGGPGDWYRIRVYVASFLVSSFEDGGYYCP